MSTFFHYCYRWRASGNRISVFAGARACARRQAGLTLIEMVVTIALLAILFAMAIGGYRYYSANRALDVASREIVTQIRQAQSMAVSTGNTHRVYFDVSDNSLVMQRWQGSEWVSAAPTEQLPSAVTYDSSNPPDFGGDTYVELFARGTSESGSLVLQNRNSQIKTISVDGETVNITESG